MSDNAKKSWDFVVALIGAFYLGWLFNVHQEEFLRAIPLFLLGLYVAAPLKHRQGDRAFFSSWFSKKGTQQ